MCPRKQRVACATLAVAVLWLSGCARQAKTTNIEEAEAAVFLIETTVQVKGDLPEPRFNTERVQQLFQSLLQTHGEDSATLRVTFLSELSQNFSDYVMRGASRPFNLKTGGTGSGFLLTTDGLLVTNAHVVQFGAEEKQQIFQQVLQQSAAELIQQDLRSLFGQNGLQGFTKDEAESLGQALVEFYVNEKQLEVSEPSVWAIASEKAGQRAGERITCQVVQEGESAPGKDVAILKMNAANAKGFATLSLARGKHLMDGEQLTVIGFPGVTLGSAESSVFSKKSRIQPSLSRGIVSGRRDLKGGWKAIQTDAAINPGNSGGPALDAQLRVIGLATFTTNDPATGNRAEGINFLVPVEVIEEFLPKHESASRAATPATLRQSSGRGRLLLIPLLALLVMIPVLLFVILRKQ